MIESDTLGLEMRQHSVEQTGGPDAAIQRLSEYRVGA